jgi:hypothetical protein
MFGLISFTPVERIEEMLSVDPADDVARAAIITMHRAAIRRIRLSKSGNTVLNWRRCLRNKYSVP